MYAADNKAPSGKTFNTSIRPQPGSANDVPTI